MQNDRVMRMFAHAKTPFRSSTPITDNAHTRYAQLEQYVQVECTRPRRSRSSAVGARSPFIEEHR